jgi:hypothetical protein
MDLKQSCNVFLTEEQYREIKKLGFTLNIPYSQLIREGVDIVVEKYRNKKNNK